MGLQAAPNGAFALTPFILRSGRVNIKGMMFISARYCALFAYNVRSNRPNNTLQLPFW